MFRPSALFCGLIFLMLLGRGAAALEIRETLWGFDGRVVPGRMNVLSLRVANPDASGFDGELTLRETSGVAGSAGAPYVQPVYLTPGTERWVQFTVFISGGYEDFVVEWGRNNFPLTHLTIGPPARVILTDAENPLAGRTRMKALPDALFPTTVAATDGLDGVVLDYVPRWEPARREAFVDWLRRGGKVIVLQTTNGSFPRFADQLAVLNIEGESARVGAGTVLRLPVTRRTAGEQLFTDHGFPAPTIKAGGTDIIFNLEQTLFQRLAGLTRPQIRWWIIELLTVLYILVVGPVHYRWGRRLDYRVSLGAFVGCVALFGFGFSVVGRRGYAEAQTVHSLSLARAVGLGRYDVTQWISAFATRGDIYSLTHAAASNLYATQTSEAINGRIINGREGRFIADIPLYSSRQFIHRAVMPAPDLTATVEQWEESGDHLKTLALRVGAAFPGEIMEARVRFRDRYYALQRAGDRFTLADGEQAQAFGEFLSREKVQMAMAVVSNAEAKPTGGELSQALPLLYVRAVDGTGYFQQSIARGSQPGDRLEFYVFAKSPPSFALQGKGFGHENGYTLFVQEVLKP